MHAFKNLVATALLCSGLAVPALGQCHIYRWNVPDFDQKRDALPGDGGMYCVPTSATNWMAYIANRGYPFMMSGPRDWQSQANYSLVTQTDASMGVLMSTSATGGTGGNTGLTGLQSYMFGRAPYLFSASVWYGNITPFDMYFQMLTNGLVNICYGYYKQAAGAGGYYYYRDGGHCVTLNGLTDVCSPSPIIRVRNPADDSMLSSQSTFATATSRGLQETFRDFPLSGSTKTLTRLADFGVGSTTRRYVDTMYIIRSNFACWSPATALPEIHLTFAASLFGDSSPQNRVFTLPSGAIADSIAIHPDQSKAAYVRFTPAAIASSHRLRLLNLADGSDTDVGLLLPAVQGQSPITFDRFGRLIVCDGSVLKVFDLSGRAPEIAASRPLASPASSICFDDVLDEIVVLTPGNRRLIRFSKDLSSAIDEPLPSGVPVMGDGSVIPDPTASGRYLVTIPGTASVHELSIIPGTPRLALTHSLHLPAVQSVQDIHPADGGIFVVADGRVRVLDRDPLAGRLRLAPTQVFGGLPAMRSMSLTRSRTNFDPAIHTGPAWDNIVDPGEGVVPIPDCPADFNLSGTVTVQDLFDFLAAYFAGDPHADINGSASITVQDIFDFLAAYFRGCD
ncbi:MAG: hypothetical protein IT438_13700 [Phycisphaerales bacterium]|nr:hypothetical protein [Phycisphaerales bacterium]